MNPGILGLALQQRQEKERLRCKQGLPPQITLQVRAGTKSDLDELFKNVLCFWLYYTDLQLIFNCNWFFYFRVNKVWGLQAVCVCMCVCVVLCCRRQEEGTRCPAGWTMTGTRRHLSRLWMSGSEPPTTNPHSMGEFMVHVIVMRCRYSLQSCSYLGTNVGK